MKPFPPIAVCLTVLLASLSAPTQADSTSLGRLFFTPERRMAMDRQRLLNIQETQTLEGATLRLDGLVQRSTGKRTIWLNGRAQNDANEALGVTVRNRADSPGKAQVTIGDEIAAELNVGETLNRATREKTAGIANGNIVIKPASR